MGEGGFCTKNANFFAFLKKKFWGDLGEFGAGDARTLESGDSRFRGNGERGGMGERGEWEVLFLGGVFIWCFLGMFLFGGCWRSENESAGAKTKQLPIPAKAGISRLTGAGRATPGLHRFRGMRCGRCPHTGIGRFPLSREWGEGGNGGKGGMGGIGLGEVFLFGVFLGMFLFGGVLAE